MKIIHEYPVKVFVNDYEGNKYYRLGLSKKDINGNYVNGYIDCRFRKGVEVDTTKKIYLQDCWLDYYVKDKITKHYIFINKFEYVGDVIKETKEEPKEESDPFEEFGEENKVELDDLDLPF